MKKRLLIIGIPLGLAWSMLIISVVFSLSSCAQKPVIHEIHYVPSHGYTLQLDDSTPCTKHDDVNKVNYKNQRQYPNRHPRKTPGRCDSDYDKGF